MLRVFISGLSKGSGKSLITAGLAATMQSLSYSTGVFKPIRTGTVLSENTSGISLIKKCDPHIAAKVLYSLSNPVSPFVGAYEDNVTIDINEIYSEYRLFSDKLDCCFVEGGNSISSPIAQDLSEVDIVKVLNIPLVFVVNPCKNSVDEVLMALSYIKANKIPLLGVIINKYEEMSANTEIKYFPQIVKELSGIKVLGCLPDYGEISLLDPGVLISDILNELNLEELFGVKIAKLDEA